MGIETAQDIVPRRYDERDAPAVLQLLTEAFGRWPVVDVGVPHLEHLRWKLRSCPEAPSYQVVAERNGKIVGSLLSLVQHVMVRGRTLLAQHGVDTVVAPAFQGKGLLTKMVAFAEEHVLGGIDLRFGHTGHPAALRHYLHTFQPFGNPVLVLERELPRGERTKRWAARWSVQESCGFDDQADEFFARAAEPFDFVVARSKDYLNWRYADARSGEFAIRTVEQHRQVLGYSVLRMSNGRGHVADLLVLPDRDDVLDCLLADALDYFRAAQAPVVEYWTPAHHPYLETVRGHGFVRYRRTVPFLWKDRRASGGLEFLLRPDAALHLMAGDSDLV